MSSRTDLPPSAAPLTFRGPARAGAPPAIEVREVHRDEVAPQRVLEIERYDTADLRLAAAGITLAVLRGDAPASWELRTPGDGGPLRVPVDVDAPRGRLPVPDGISDLVRGAARGRPLRPVGRVRTIRVVHRLLDASGARLATVVHDRVTLSTLGRSTEVKAWTEVTIDAPAALRGALADRATAAGLRPAAPCGEAELARLLRPAPCGSRPKRKTAGGALVAYLAEQNGRLAAADLRVRRGEPDGVHRLRVAARRMRSALRGYRRLLDRAQTDPLVAGLRALSRELGPARDAEVQRERVLRELAELPDELRLGAASAVATRYFARIESEAAAAALAVLDGPEYAQLRERLDRLVADPPLRGRAGRSAKKELPRHVAEQERRFAARVAHALDPELSPERRAAALHAARKAGKRLRYVAEVARPAVGRPAKRHARAVERIQQAIGEHQDTVVARATLRSLGALAHVENENGFAFGVLHGRAEARAAAVEAQLPGLWTAASRSELLRWLR
ncbi:CHAD domain-containing protein [Pseudonocardia thermophila]|uniref:CHAD domain-containing protein n=1 Tax=Pseudonocardia thermophila TaxID=1848 RepID=A0A1M6Q633_PSETH|nr:CYTH and CHAD domain-containing protein [Pseudonocardia thermophila]SHK15661.1 CHAD domain-containing protein [Pseudonocardia thermophila]